MTKWIKREQRKRAAERRTRRIRGKMGEKKGHKETEREKIAVLELEAGKYKDGSRWVERDRVKGQNCKRSNINFRPRKTFQR